MTGTTETRVEVWEERAQDAEAKAQQARRTVEELEAERPVLAVAANSGDEEAQERLRELKQEISEAREELEVAELAAAEAHRVINEGRRLAERERLLKESAAKRERYDTLASRRAALEKQAQEALDNLVATLDELADVNLQQRLAAKALDIAEAANMLDPWRLTNNWLAAHLRDHAPDLPFMPSYRKPLSELHRLPKFAPTDEDKALLAEVRQHEAEQRKTAEQRRAESQDRAVAIRDRRTQLLAQTSHASQPRSIQKDIEAKVEATLREEFPPVPGLAGPRPAQVENGG